jgi:hypothetical protein
LGEAYEVRMILEIIMWGGWAVFLEALVNMGGLANLANSAYPNAPGNDIGRFEVEILYYKIVGFMKLLQSFFKMLMWLASLLFFAVRMTEYGKHIPYDMTSKWMDLAMVIIIPFLLIPYIYEFVWACFEIAQWLPVKEDILFIDFYNVSTFFNIVKPEE